MTADEESLFAAVALESSLGPSERVAEITRLVGGGANVNVRGEYGLTPLHCAVAAPYRRELRPPELEVIRCLLDLGADANAESDRGMRPLNGAIALNDTDTPAAIARSKEVLELLVTRGARPNRTPPLSHYSCCELSLYELLLRIGGDVGARDNHGNTPLHGAVSAGRPKLVALLLARDIDVDATNRQGKTPLGLALKLPEYSAEQTQIKREMVALLERKGSRARVAVERADGTTPVDAARLAAAHGATQLDPRIVRLFAGTYDTYEELAVELTKALYPEHYVAALAVCAAAQTEPPTKRVMDGDQTVRVALFHHGDLVVLGNLRIVAPFAVTGSLSVSGYVEDCGPDSKVVVLGDVAVASLYTTGEFHVGGALVAEDVVYGYYNDNTLSAKTISARVVIEDDHSTAGDVASPHHFDMDRYQQGYGDGVTEELQQIFVSEVFYPDDHDDYPSMLDKERLIVRLAKREPVFR